MKGRTWLASQNLFNNAENNPDISIIYKAKEWHQRLWDMANKIFFVCGPLCESEGDIPISYLWWRFHMLLILAKKYEPHDLYFESLMQTDTITNMQINQTSLSLTYISQLYNWEINSLHPSLRIKKSTDRSRTCSPSTVGI